MAVPTTATMLAEPGAIEHSEATAFGLNPGGWVALAMIVVIAIIIWKGGARAIGRSLDNKIAAIRAQLDEAAKLRAEAEALRAEYQARQQEAAAEAEAIVRHAQVEAAAIREQAQAETAALVARRARMAQDRIAAAERQAIAAVRGHAAEVAVRAATHLIAERHDGDADRPLVDRTISGMGRA